MENALTLGSIVRCRDREWVVLPSSDPEIVMLRPLTGSESEKCGIYLPLANLGFDRLEPAQFPLPTPNDAGDAINAELLWHAARLSLRDGAGPFRSLGRISLRPRAYQFVPMLMALRIDPIRLLIADDVGVGKTIEALLIARELLDRGEIQRLCVLCPPYLCDQWKKELWEKFSLTAVVIRSGTINQLERDLPAGEHSIFGYYPYLVVSIDYAKSDRHRANFLHHCPELVIVDEAHGAAKPGGHATAQQQRHELLVALAQKENQHLILLTATPHSGVEESFLSLLGLLKAEFSKLDLSNLNEKQMDALQRHFVQRPRAQIVRWMGEDTRFPERVPVEETYTLSAEYRSLFNKIYEFSRELVQSSETLTGWKKRIRFWTALALLRCVMSSPAAAVAAIKAREKGLGFEEEGLDDNYAPYIYESSDEETIDAQPAHIVGEGESELGDSERRRLREFARQAEGLKNKADHKLDRCERIVRDLLQEGYQPIIWCRYIATSDYVAEALKARLEGEFPGLRVISITGAKPEDERRSLVEELALSPRHILVATDCLSEGINLQEAFSAVVHYDLPWNPNRLEQREGRVDRFGQPSPKVKAVLLYGRDNPVDGAVLDVLLRKARQIHRTLGIMVPVPVDSATVMEVVLKTLFLRGPQALQLQLPLFPDPVIEEFQSRLDQAVKREQESRSRFAQRGIKPEEVERELEATDSVLGDPLAVERFVLNACKRLGASYNLIREQVWELLSLDRLPELARGEARNLERWRVTFSSPPPKDAEYLGRNHPFVAALAQYLLEAALTQDGEAPATRCGVIRTRQVALQTTLLMLRLRFQLEEPGSNPMLAEEIFVVGFQGYPPDQLRWLDENEARRLLLEARPDANISPQERQSRLAAVLEMWLNLQNDLTDMIQERAGRLQDAHRRVRSAAGLARRGVNVQPHLPPDLLGVLVLMPIPKGIAPQAQGGR